MRTGTYLLIVLATLMGLTATQATLAVSVNPLTINSQAEYTLVVAFSDSALRFNLTVYLPQELTFTNNMTVTKDSILLNSSQYALNQTNRSILILYAVGNTTLVVNNILNPSSAIATFDFTLSTNISTDSTSPTVSNFVDFTANSLQSCLFAFTGTTEQINSTLLASMVLSDSLPAGLIQVTIGYPLQW